MSDADTIVAAATPPGRGGIGIVRLSGPGAPAIATAVLGTLPAARRAVFAAFRDAQHQTLDAGLVLYFPGPHSYTGEEVVEFHGHGGPIIVESLISRLVELGARRANPGEFTQRAFLNANAPASRSFLKRSGLSYCQVCVLYQVSTSLRT